MIETTCSETIVQIIEVGQDVEPQVVLISDDTPQVIIAQSEPGPQGLPGPQGEAGISKLGDATDVDTSSAQNGSLLVYSTNVEKWVATRTLENQYVDSGQY